MEQRDFGKTGLKVSVLGLGAAEVGYSDAAQERVDALVGGALDAGLNVIDTAECYVTSEELIGRAVEGRRQDVLLFTKCGHSHGYGDPDWDKPARLEKSLEQSLKRLRTDRLDLFQLHSCSRQDLERGEVVAFMQKAKQAGKTRFIGYSGDNDAARYAVSTGVFDALQISVSLADQSCLDRILPEAVKRGMGVIAKRPLGNVVWRQETSPGGYYAAYWERFKALDYAFLKDEAAAVPTALRFALSAPGVSVAIVGTQQPGRWQENARMAALGPLSRAEYDAIRRRWNAAAGADWAGQV